jgi:REP element-mobilizing transposase RayT
MSSTKTPILPGNIYHLYNQANLYQLLFKNDENYNFFLRRYEKYLSDFFETYAYCLMPNHFHFLIKVKDYTPELNKQGIESEEIYTKKVTNALKNFLVSYSNSYRKVYGTRGNLFRQKTRRKIVDSDEYFVNLINYIHLNPVYHKFVINTNDWKHCSYKSYFSEEESFLNKEYVLDYFGDIENFKFCHDFKTLEFIAEKYELEY